MTPAELEAAERAGLVDESGRLTPAGRILVGERSRLEPLRSWAQRWAAKRGPITNPNTLRLIREAGGA